MAFIKCERYKERKKGETFKKGGRLSKSTKGLKLYVGLNSQLMLKNL